MFKDALELCVDKTNASLRLCLNKITAVSFKLKETLKTSEIYSFSKISPGFTVNFYIFL